MIGANWVVASGGLGQEARAGEVEPLDAAREHIALVEIAAVEAEPQHVLGDAGARPAAELHAAGAGDVADDGLGIEGDAPGLQQLVELGEIGRPLHHHHHGVALALRLRHGIDERQHLAAAKRELVDGVGRVGGQPLGLHDHQHVDVGRNLLGVLGDRLELEELADLLQHDHRRRRAARPIIGLPGLPSMGMPLMRPTRALGWLASVTISLVTSYSRNRSRSVDRKGRLASVSVELRSDEAEIAHLAFLVEANALEAGGHGAILGVGERLGIEEGDLQLAARDVAVLLQQRAHALEDLGVAGRGLAELLGEVDADVDRLVDGAQGFARALGDRVEAFLGEIDPGVAQRARGDQVDGQQDDGAQRQAAPGQLCGD